MSCDWCGFSLWLAELPLFAAIYELWWLLDLIPLCSYAPILYSFLTYMSWLGLKWRLRTGRELSADLQCFLCVSSLCYSVLWILATLASLKSQFYLFNSRRPPDFVIVPSILCHILNLSLDDKLGETVGLTWLFSNFSEITVFHCLKFNVFKTIVLYILSIF